MIRRGEPWGEPFAGPPDHEVTGDDADLADLAARAGATEPGPRCAAPTVRFRPAETSDLARAVGLRAGEAGPWRASGVALPLDALLVETTGLGDDAPGWAGIAVNAVIVGTRPARLRWSTRAVELEVDVDGRTIFAGATTTVVVASGQFVDGLAVAPRSHPGDGRVEVQVYALRRSERVGVRARLPQGAHLPHPRITERRGTRAEVRSRGAAARLTADGRPRPSGDRVRVEVVPGALRLLL